jgi:hypothetical protein
VTFVLQMHDACEVPPPADAGAVWPGW